MSAQEPRPPQPRFETGTEVVLVDVSVLSQNGEPVNDLTAADFKLTVNGQPRPVHTVQFISTRETKTAKNEPRLARVSSNDGPTSGRLLLFVIDENHLRLGGARALLRTAERVMNGLAQRRRRGRGAHSHGSWRRRVHDRSRTRPPRAGHRDGRAADAFD